ncbi:hypothetical protein TNCV_3386331 [Trichonephila clavipes]|nr:hypothetical protein TNCV_3386331 [Trichonephila clavipes]
MERGSSMLWSPSSLVITPMNFLEYDFAASKATDHDVVGDETENNSANPQTLVVEDRHEKWFSRLAIRRVYKDLVVNSQPIRGCIELFT